MKAVSLMGTTIGNLKKHADAHKINPDKLRVVDALKRIASRDSSRGGGPLTSEDEAILDCLATDATLTDCITTAKEVVTPGRKLQDVVVCVVDEDEPKLMVVDKPDALN